MKTKIAALGLLLATVGGQAALAQDHDRDRDRGPAPQAAPPTPHPQPQAPPPHAERPQFQHPQGERPQFQHPQAPPQGGRPQGQGPGGWQPRPQGEPSHVAPIPSQSWSNGHARYGAPPPNGGREDAGRPRPGAGGDHGDHWNGGDRNGGDHWNGGRPGGGDPNWNRGDHNGDHNGDRGGYRGGPGDHDGRPGWRPGQGGDHRPDRWDRHRYPPVYRSQHRYRAPAWYPPVGFYSHSWAFGEILPRGWYAEQYMLTDWWDYDLPEPPPGYDWVRVGADALLIDDYSGRIVQVVRDLFW